MSDFTHPGVASARPLSLDVAVEAARQNDQGLSFVVAALAQAHTALPAAALPEYETLARFGPEVAGF